MPIETLAALVFSVVYMLGAFFLAMGAAVVARFAVELVRTVKR